MTEPEPEPPQRPDATPQPEPRPPEPTSAEPTQPEPTQPEPTPPEPTPRPPAGTPLLRHSPFALGFFGALGVLVAVALQTVLAAASSVILLIVVALFLAVGLDPAVEQLVRRGVRRALAVTLVFAAVLLALVLFGLALVPVISDQVGAIVRNAPQLVQDLQSNEWVRSLDQRFDVLGRVRDQLTSGAIGQRLAGGVLGVGLAVLGALVNTLVVTILTLYFLASLPRMKQNTYRLVPASRRDRVAELGDEVLRRIGSYVGGAFLVALCAGVTSLVFLLVVGLGEYAVALAFVVMLLDFVPLIGATIGAVIVSAIGLAVDPSIGLACVIFYLIYQQVENYLIYPRVMSNSVDVPGAIIVIAVLAGGALLGVVGALLAIPVAAGILLVVREVLIRRQDQR